MRPRASPADDTSRTGSERAEEVRPDSIETGCWNLMSHVSWVLLQPIWCNHLQQQNVVEYYYWPFASLSTANVHSPATLPRCFSGDLELVTGAERELGTFYTIVVKRRGRITVRRFVSVTCLDWHHLPARPPPHDGIWISSSGSLVPWNMRSIDRQESTACSLWSSAIEHSALRPVGTRGTSN